MATKTVSELAELFGVTRQAMNNRVRALAEELTEKNDRGYTVVNNAGIAELERLYGKVVTAEQEVVSEHAQKRTAVVAAAGNDKTVFAMLSQLVEGKDEEIKRLEDQLARKDSQLRSQGQQLQMMGGQLDIKDRQIAEKDKQLDQQQQLTAAALQDREQILLELHEEQSKGFFARLFKGKKK